MKKILVIVITMLIPMFMFATGPNGAAAHCPLTADCYTPIKIVLYNYLQQESQIPHVYRGEYRILNPDNNEVVSIGFKMTKDAGKSATVTMDIPNYPVHGVRLVGSWSSSPEGIFQRTPIEGNSYQWAASVPIEMLYLEINTIDARTENEPGGMGVQLGLATFPVHVTAQYNF